MILEAGAETKTEGVRYDFGQNWSRLAQRFEEAHVEAAASDLARLCGNLDGKTFFDLGCGSGLHAAAALRLGASRVLAVDYDPQSVATAKAVLARFAPGMNWQVERADATSPATLPSESFDVVYSWGVLHHTGDLAGSVRNAASLVAPGAVLCLALYLKTPLCGFWRAEKRLYAQHRWLRPPVKALFVASFLLARALRSGDPFSYVREYRRRRGMGFLADVDDWLGGYPYESVIPERLEAMVAALGFTIAARFNTRPGLGVFGTGCGEWRFARTA